MPYNPYIVSTNKSTLYTPDVGSSPDFRQFGSSPDQQLLTESYNAQQSLQALNTAARLKHLRDLNLALARMGQGVGSDGTAAISMAERNPYAGGLGVPVAGYGMPQAPGLYQGQPVQWQPPLSAAQQMANMRPVTAATGSPYPRYGSDGSLPAGGLPPTRSSMLNNLMNQVSNDQVQSYKNSWYIPLEPHLSTEQKLQRQAQQEYDVALAKAQGQRDGGGTNLRQQQTVNVGRAPVDQSVGSPRGTMPTANATLTDNRVRANNDTKLAEQLIYNGGITTQAQLRDQFPDADWSRLGSLLTAVQQGPQRQYETAKSSADLANQALQNEIDRQAQAQADKQYGAAPWFEGSAAKQNRLDAYNQTVLDPQIDLAPQDVQKILKPYQNEIQYNQDSGTFEPIMRQPVAPSENPPGYISRQDMPGQNFHTDLQRSQPFNGLPIVRNQADIATLPPGAQFVTGNGQIGTVPGGYRGGPRYIQPLAQQPDQFAQDFADAGLASDVQQPRSVQMPQFVPNQAVNFGQQFGPQPDAQIGNRVNFFTPANRPNVGNAVNFSNTPSGPRQTGDGTYIVADPSDLAYVPPGGVFIGPDGIKRRKH